MHIEEKVGNTRNEGDLNKRALTRREVLKKYGAYTTPSVIGIILPSQLFAHPDDGVTIYSTVGSCNTDGNHGGTPLETNGHCSGAHMIAGG